VTWAWTLIPQTLAQTGVPSGKAFNDWRELAAMVLLGVGFVLLVGTLGTMWRNRWRNPQRESSSRLDQLTSLEMDSPSESPSPALPATAPTPAESDRLKPVVRTTQPAVPIAERGQMAPTVAEAQQLLDAMNAAEDMTGRLGAQIDEKADRLRTLIAQAQRAIDDLETATKAAATARPTQPAAPAITPQPPAPMPVVTVRHAPSLAATAAAVHGSGVGGVGGALQARERAEAASRTTVPSLVASDPSGPDPLTGEIYRLSDQGMPAIEIARRMNQHVGKVELILALRPG
jgi:hypothetical protein